MRKNAFTLIELLAVIVILAIIALIAVPIVINIINDSKEESLKRSVQNYLDAATNTITKENLKIKYNPDECKIQDNGDLICSENGNELTTSNGTNKLVIDIKGKKPSSGTIKLKDGKITNIINLSLKDTRFMFDSKGNIVINKNTQIAGLYDENNNLLATWDELVNVYKLDITKDYINIYKQGTMYSVLNNNDKLKNGTVLILDEEISEIGNRAFQDCSSLTSIEIPDSVTSIGDYAFHDCSSLANVKLGSSVISIGNYAFAHCTSLVSITIPDSVTSIGIRAFYDCTSLANVTLGSSVTSIGEDAFRECGSLTSVTIPDSVTSIGADAFSECGSLTSVTLGNGVTSIRYGVFSGCSSLTSIEIPSSVTSIGSFAFSGCSSLTSIEIPSSVTIIGEGAFKKCKNLVSATFEDTVGWYKVNMIDEEEIIDVTDPVENAKTLRYEKETSSSGNGHISIDDLDSEIRLIKK